MKYLVTFEKGESVRWLGHLDILRTFERAIRRADLPIAFSAGFNPRERIAFANALGVGVTGEAELATLELTAPVEPPEIVNRLNGKLPPGIRLSSAREIAESGSRDLLNSFDRADVCVTCVTQNFLSRDEVQRAADRILTESKIELEREREGKIKRVDIRPFIYAIRADDPQDGRIALRMILAISQDGSAKPAEIVGIMARELPGLALRRVHRVRLLASGIGASAQHEESDRGGWNA